MSQAQAVRLGPFVGGLNNASDPSALSDNEMVDCINFELDLDGSLVQRPPIFEVMDGGHNHLTAIGTAFIADVSYVLFSSADGTYAYDGTNWLTVKAGLISKVAVQYRDLVYVVAISGSAQAGGYWNPVAATFTSDANMPRGEAAVFYKARFWVVPGISSTTNRSRLTFSDIITTDLFVWNPASIIDVSPGDGQLLMDIVVYNDNLVLFKEDSTWVLAYDLQVTDAILRSVNTKIGASNRFCVVSFENSLFVYHEGKVFEMSNYDYTQINIKVPFFLDNTSPAGDFRIDNHYLCLLGDRLVVRYFNRIYVYGLRTKTWTRWVSADSSLQNMSRFLAFPVASDDVNVPRYYGGSTLALTTKIYGILDGYDNTKEHTLTDDITIQSSLLTKNYDFGDSWHYKKLMWWGADILTNQDIMAHANPVVNTFRIRWVDLASHRWSELNSNYWFAPLLSVSGVETDIVSTNTVSREFVKLRKTLRFRQVNFDITLLGDGTTATGPCRVFSFTAHIASKQVVSKQVT